MAAQRRAEGEAAQNRSGSTRRAPAGFPSDTERRNCHDPRYLLGHLTPKQPPRRALDRGERRGGNQHPPSLPTAVRTRAPSSGRGTVPLTAHIDGGQGRRGEQTTGTAVVAGPGTRRVGPVPGRPRAVIIPSRPPLALRALRAVGFALAWVVGVLLLTGFGFGALLLAGLYSPIT